jgi:hypothetical protein
MYIPVQIVLTFSLYETIQVLMIRVNDSNLNIIHKMENP